MFLHTRPRTAHQGVYSPPAARAIVTTARSSPLAHRVHGERSRPNLPVPRCPRVVVACLDARQRFEGAPATQGDDLTGGKLHRFPRRDRVFTRHATPFAQRLRRHQDLFCLLHITAHGRTAACIRITSSSHDLLADIVVTITASSPSAAAASSVRSTASDPRRCTLRAICGRG